MMHYSDKRDIGTLEYQMTSLAQRNNTITEFYQQVYQHLSLILDKVACLDLDDGALTAMTNAYRDKALDTFVRGLRGDLPRLLSIREPTSLPQALHMCLKLENMTFRMNYAQGSYATIRHGNSQAPPIPRRTQPVPFRNGFFPELAHMSRPFQRTFAPQNRPFIQRPQFHSQNYQHNPTNGNYRYQQNYGNPPQPRPEPMDIDSSLQTRLVYYQNRPNFKPNYSIIKEISYKNVLLHNKHNFNQTNNNVLSI